MRRKDLCGIPAGQFVERTFYKKDIVVLDGLRCSGLSHDGCQWLCLLFWKTAWLRSAVGTARAHPSSASCDEYLATV
jgi:hypothetical protein